LPTNDAPARFRHPVNDLPFQPSRFSLGSHLGVGILWGALMLGACSAEISSGGKAPVPTPTRAALGPTPTPSPIDRTLDTSTDTDNIINRVNTPLPSDSDEPVVHTTVIAGGMPGVVSTVVESSMSDSTSRQLWTCRELSGPQGSVSHCAQFLVDPARTGELGCVSSQDVVRQLAEGGNCPAQGYIVKCSAPTGYPSLAAGVGVYAWSQYVSTFSKAQIEQACRSMGGTPVP
jgi:hypothetical protein